VADVGPRFDVGSDHEAGGVAEEEDREVEGVAELHESGGLVGTVGVDGAAEVGGVVGDDADGAALDAAQRGDHPRPETASQLEPGVGVGERVHDGPDVVCPEPVLGHQCPEPVLVGRGPGARRPGEVREVALRDGDRFAFVPHR
jgi:hypothetical protein